jgi:hypothetical protein
MAYLYLRDNTNMNMDIVNIIISYNSTRPEWVKFWNDIVLSRIRCCYASYSVRQQLFYVYECEACWLDVIDEKLFNIRVCKCDMLEELVQTRDLIN